MLKTKEMLIDEESREVIKDTVNKFEKLVTSTMGPSGKTIALHSESLVPVITKDGVTVAKAIKFDNPSMDLIAEILKEAAEKTNREAGDGTSGSTAIAAETMRLSYSPDFISEEINNLRSSVLEGKEKVISLLEKMKVDFSNETDEKKEEILYKIAMISTNGDHALSTIVSKAILMSGINGTINVKTGNTHSITKIGGIKINSGAMSPEFFSGSIDKKITLKRCRVLITTHNLESAPIVAQISQKILEPIIQRNESFLIITREAGKGFLDNQIKLNSKGTLANVVVKAPYFGTVGRDMLDDLAAAFNTSVIDDLKGHILSNVELNDLGFVDEVQITPMITTFIKHEESPLLKERIEKLREEAKRINFNPNDTNKTVERLNTLTGSVYTINIPSFSEIEDKERTDRIEDAKNACLGALQYGYVPGGGFALLKIGALLSEDHLGERFLKKLLRYPSDKIRENAGLPPIKYEEVTETSQVYDIRNKKAGDPLEIGVIDSYKVIRDSFLNGLSVGLTLTTTTGIIANIPQENKSFEWGY